MIDTVVALERLILESIPLSRAMELGVLDYDGNRLALAAPLAPNVNDKGCAFGGSIVSLMTLSAWGLIQLKLGAAAIDAEVFVADSAVSYLSPVWDALVAEAFAEPGQDWDGFIATLRAEGKARITVVSEISAAQGGGVAAKMFARFVAKRGEG